jgi:site-specific recombinase XerD
LEPEIESAAAYARAEKAAATRRAYRSDFALFRCWCETKRLPALPASPEAVAAFLAVEANRGAKVATISRRLAAIRYAHKLAGHEPPTNSEAVKATLRGIRRTAGSAPARKTPATADKLVAMVAKAGTDLKGLRDRALLLLGFAGAFRRSELVALSIADLEFCAGGLRVIIRKSKTDRKRRTSVVVRTCALLAFARRSMLTSGVAAISGANEALGCLRTKICVLQAPRQIGFARRGLKYNFPLGERIDSIRDGQRLFD